MLAPMAVRAPPALKTLACRRKATQRHPFFSIAPYVPNRLANLGQRAKIMRLRHQILLARLLRSFHRVTTHLRYIHPRALLYTQFGEDYADSKAMFRIRLNHPCLQSVTLQRKSVLSAQSLFKLHPVYWDMLPFFP